MLHKTPNELADLTPAQLHIFLVDKDELKQQGGRRRVSRAEAIELMEQRKKQEAKQEKWHGF